MIVVANTGPNIHKFVYGVCGKMVVRVGNFFVRFVGLRCLLDARSVCHGLFLWWYLTPYVLVSVVSGEDRFWPVLYVAFPLDVCWACEFMWCLLDCVSLVFAFAISPVLCENLP